MQVIFNSSASQCTYSQPVLLIKHVGYILSIPHLCTQLCTVLMKEYFLLLLAKLEYLIDIMLPFFFLCVSWYFLYISFRSQSELNDCLHFVWNIKVFDCFQCFVCTEAKSSMLVNQLEEEKRAFFLKCIQEIRIRTPVLLVSVMCVVCIDGIHISNTHTSPHLTYGMYCSTLIYVK
jgi:hypothetical protein